MEARGVMPDVALTAGETIASARVALARSFAAEMLESPELDARILVGHALGLDAASVLSQATRQLTSLERAAIAALAQRRLARDGRVRCASPISAPDRAPCSRHC